VQPLIEIKFIILDKFSENLVFVEIINIALLFKNKDFKAFIVFPLISRSTEKFKNNMHILQTKK